MKNLGILFYGLIVLAINSVMSAYVLMKLWGWIITPAFNIEKISMGVAFGIAVMLSFIIKRKSSNNEVATAKKLTKALIEAIVLDLLFLGMGWIASLFI